MANAPISMGTEPEHILTFRRLTYKPWTALGEFIDNSTSSYRANREALDKAYAQEAKEGLAPVNGLVVKVVFGKNAAGEDILRIRDTAMGMSHDELTNALKIGKPPAGNMFRSKYGMGMKTASCWFGNIWTITTSKLGEKGGHRIEVDVNRIAKGDMDLRYQFIPDHKESEHFTVIEISDLQQGIAGRTIGKVKDFLSSMYRVDLSPIGGAPTMELWYNDVKISGESFRDDEFLVDSEGRPYKKEFSFSLGKRGDKDRSVRGWVGILKNGSRAKAGFSIFSSERMVRGYPDSWRPTDLYGQLQGSNDLVNQRLVGEVYLEGFIETMSKDDINWQGDEEDRLSEKLKEIAEDYRKTAQKYRRHSDDERGPSDFDKKVALEALAEELGSIEIREILSNSAQLPSEELVKKDQDLLRKKLEEAQKFDLIEPIGDLSAHVKIDNELTPLQPYMVWTQSSDGKKFYVGMNMHHPILETFQGSADLVLFLRLCAYEAIAEYIAQKGSDRVRPESIRQIKSNLMSLRHQMEQHDPEDTAQVS